MAKNIPKHMPVTSRVLIKRINRKLVHVDEVLKISRSVYMKHQAGQYYIVNVCVDGLIERNVDIVELGRKLRALKPSEDLAD